MTAASKQRSDTSVCISAERLTFRYDEVSEPVFQHVSFQINRCDRVLILGPSGSGKSTLSYCLGGLYPSAVDGLLNGRLDVMGKPAADYGGGELSQRIGYVFQDPDSQFCMVKVEDELAFVLENNNVPDEQMDEKLTGALRSAGLEDRRHSAIHELSGGMKQRLSLACALASDPDILILDEPTSNLDPLSTLEFVQYVAGIAELKYKTLLVIEHKLDAWIVHMNRCLAMDEQGKLWYDGTPRELFAEHSDRLYAYGIWTPLASEFGRRWERDRLYDAERLPLTLDELAEGCVSVEESIKRLSMGAVKVGSDAMAAPLLEAEITNGRRGRRSILRDVRLSVQEGEILAIVGPNGSGKTTLALHLAGLAGSHGGDGQAIRVRNRPIALWKEADLRKQIGFVFQNPEHQFIADSVFEELAFSLRLQKLPADEIHRRVMHILQLCRLDHLANENPFALSHGQKRRLSVATMLVDEQSLLILDEPTFGQDARGTEELMKLMVSRKQQGKSTVLITHDMEIVDRFADRAAVLLGGTVVFDGAPEALWSSSQLVEQAQLALPFARQLVMKLKEGQARCLL